MNEFDSFRCPLNGLNLVEAGAGTGKTYNLQNLFVRLLLEPSAALPIERILVVTFTEAATAELRKRLRRILVATQDFLENRELSQPEERERIAALTAGLTDLETARQRLRVALRDLDRAAISTIHGFCRRVLDENAFESGIRFGLELEKNPQPLRLELLTDYYRRETYPGSAFQGALWKSLELLPEELARDLRIPAEHPELKLHFGETPGAPADLLPELESQWHTLRQTDPQALAPFAQYLLKPFNEKELPGLIERTVSLLQSDYPPPFKEFAPWALLEPGNRIFRAGLTPEKQGELERQLRALPFVRAMSDWRSRCRSYRLAVLNQALTQLRCDFVARQQRDGFLTFDDLLRQLDARLSGPGGQALQRAIQTQYQAALIDEFQDTDPVQFRIFRKLFADSPRQALFLIGDPKQAIYTFRGGDLFAYLRARELVAPERRFTLTRNFRSAPALLTELNRLFGEHPAPFAQREIDFPPIRWPEPTPERSGLRFGGVLDPHPLCWVRPPGRGVEAALAECVRTIHRWLTDPAVEVPQPDGSRRRLRPDDLAVLVLSNRHGLRLQQLLSERNIPAEWNRETNIFDTAEAVALRTLLEALRHPGDSGKLSRVLAGEFHGRTGSELQELHRSGAFIELQNTFMELADCWENDSFAAMFRAYRERFQVRTHLARTAPGERGLTNLLQLEELLQQAELERKLGPAGLCRFFDNQLHPETREQREEYQLLRASEQPAVRLLSVHRSKGLEFPVVLLPDLFSRKIDSERNRQYHNEQGDPVFDFSGDATSRSAAAEEQLQELLRLCYVAMTRAVHHCRVIWPDRIGGHCALDYLCRGRTGKHRDWSEAPLELPDAWCEEPTPEPTTPYVPESKATDFRGALPFHNRIEENWGISSFTALAPEGDAVGGAADHDDVDTPEALEEEPAGIFLFPAGARAGDCWHRIFEQLDFTAAPETSIPLIDEQLRQSGLLGNQPEERRQLTRQMIHSVLHAPLPGAGFTLSEISREERLSELEFHFSCRRGFDSAEVAQLLKRCGYELDGDWKRRLDGGFMTGFIDLVFRRDGRYYLVDWKSNQLGRNLRNFEREGLRREMRRHAYFLQYLIYVVALVKFLRSRLGKFGPGEYEQQFGGVYYLFLRGVAPEAPGRGIWHDRPDYRLIAELEELIG